MSFLNHKILTALFLIPGMLLFTYPGIMSADEDLVVPVISSVSSSNDKTTATITWTTDEIASSKIEYGSTPTYGAFSIEIDISPRVTSHSVELIELGKCQTYHYRVLSTDESGNTAIGTDHNFFTTGCDDLYPGAGTAGINSACSIYNPNDEIHVRTDADVLSVRNAVIADIWSGRGFPTRQPDTVIHDIDTIPSLTTTSMTNLASIEELNILTNEFTSHVYFLTPTNSNNRLMVYHAGHGSTLNSNGQRATFEFLIAHGFSVLILQMPQTGPVNTGPVVGTSSEAHENMQELESLTLNPLEIFMEPIAVSLNYVLSHYSYQDVSMIGLSGGGWATTLYSAIDTRITKSFPIAGSMPIGLRTWPCSPSVNTAGDVGDYEQGKRGRIIDGRPANMYTNIASYLDLYILGSAGPGRKQVQILDQNDDCCFQAMRSHIYKSTVSNIVSSLSGGSFNVEIEVAPSAHAISEYDRQTSILPELKESLTVTVQGSSYSVVLGSKPISDVYISLVSSESAHGVVITPSTLTFTSSNWNTPQSVLITGGTSDSANSVRGEIISHTVTSSDELYNGIIVDDVSISRYTHVLDPANVSATQQNANTVIVTADSFPNHIVGLSGYYFSNNTNGANSGWIQANSWRDATISCGTSYSYSVKYRNGDAVETDSISITQSTARCSGGYFVPPVISSVPPPISVVAVDILSPRVVVSDTVGSPNNRLPQFAPGPAIRLGMKGTSVRILQTYLQAQGKDIYPWKTIDGIFGKQTLQAVKNFQKKYALKIDGIAGVQVKGKMLLLNTDPLFQ